MQPEVFQLAARRLRGVVHQTPLTSSKTLSALTGCQVTLKCENLQKTGSFKVRGAYNKISAMAAGDDAPLVAASAGNHAQGVAFAAAATGRRAIIYMPQATPDAKVRATAGYGARVVLWGDSFDEACARAQEDCRAMGAHFIHPFDDRAVIAGQGTLGLELVAAQPRVEAILLPAGGGGLAAGVAACVKGIRPDVRVIAVQAQGAGALAESFRQGRLAASGSTATMADGIAVRQPGRLTFGLIRRYVDDVLTVPEEAIAQAMLLLLERAKLLVEPAGAVGLAALLTGGARLEGKRVACVLSGGNLDMSLIRTLTEGQSAPEARGAATHHKAAGFPA